MPREFTDCPVLLVWIRHGISFQICNICNLTFTPHMPWTTLLLCGPVHFYRDEHQTNSGDIGVIVHVSRYIVHFIKAYPYTLTALEFLTTLLIIPIRVFTPCFLCDHFPSPIHQSNSACIEQSREESRVDFPV